ncbi:hypothetical protein [Frigoribacterium sp. SL97]|jgi:ABC-type antimicrobial peptide transport system permease subunit|uniref:hypothetical protein n=1 Tax=Frigoribacterium sp. SL97 TaxID=2994664 RepID=UPI00226D8EE5|nr:hypothetical protein [Frigoribacterium sp. SL97]WAC50490.1 hypothetical protein OVA02_11470 [Frigoribacterium sp. SL97]
MDLVPAFVGLLVGIGFYNAGFVTLVTHPDAPPAVSWTLMTIGFGIATVAGWYGLQIIAPNIAVSTIKP